MAGSQLPAQAARACGGRRAATHYGSGNTSPCATLRHGVPPRKPIIAVAAEDEPSDSDALDQSGGRPAFQEESGPHSIRFPMDESIDYGLDYDPAILDNSVDMAVRRVLVHAVPFCVTAGAGRVPDVVAASHAGPGVGDLRHDGLRGSSRQSTTEVLVGGHVLDQMYSGGRFRIGFWTDPCHEHALEADGFWIGEAADFYSFQGSGAAGTRVLARPFFNVLQTTEAPNGREDAELVAFPEQLRAR